MCDGKLDSSGNGLWDLLFDVLRECKHPHSKMKSVEFNYLFKAYLNMAKSLWGPVRYELETLLLFVLSFVLLVEPRVVGQSLASQLVS